MIYTHMNQKYSIEFAQKSETNSLHINKILYLDPYFLSFFFQEFLWTIVATVMETGVGIEIINKEYLFKNKMWKIEKSREWIAGRDAIKISPASESGSVSHSVLSDSSWPHGLQSARLLCPWNSPGKNIDMSSHALLQEIFLIQGSTLGLPHYRQILYHLSHKESSPAKEYLLSSNCGNPFV